MNLKRISRKNNWKIKSMIDLSLGSTNTVLRHLFYFCSSKYKFIAIANTEPTSHAQNVVSADTSTSPIWPGLLSGLVDHPGQQSTLLHSFTTQHFQHHTIPSVSIVSHTNKWALVTLMNLYGRNKGDQGPNTFNN